MTDARNPWVGLRPFGVDDQALFFGRDREIQILDNLVATLPVLVVYAPSGTGKSSLLNAGLSPRIEADPHQVLIRMTDPREDVVERTYAALRQRGWTAPTGLDLAEALEHHWMETDSRVVVLLDQFEERINTGDDIDPLFAAVAKLAHSRADAACIVISIREDYLGGLEPLMRRVPGLLNGSYRVPALSREALEQAVYGPFSEVAPNSTIDNALVEESLDDLDKQSAPRPEPGEQRFEPGYFQVVWSVLWEHAHREDGPRELTVLDYRELGGAASILEDFTSSALDSLEPALAETFWAISRYLVLPTGAKTALTVDDLVSLVRPDDFLPSVEGEHRWITELEAGQLRKLIVQVLRQLTSSGTPLFQRVIRSDREEYELLHDLLGTIVLGWRESFAERRRHHASSLLNSTRVLAADLGDSRLSIPRLRRLTALATAEVEDFPVRSEETSRFQPLSTKELVALVLAVFQGYGTPYHGRQVPEELQDDFDRFNLAYSSLLWRGLENPTEEVRRRIQELLPIWTVLPNMHTRPPVLPSNLPVMFATSFGVVLPAVLLAYVLASTAGSHLHLRYVPFALGHLFLGALFMYFIALMVPSPGERLTQRLQSILIPVTNTSLRNRPYQRKSLLFYLPMTWPLPIVVPTALAVLGGALFQAFDMASMAGFTSVLVLSSLASAVWFTTVTDL